MKINDYRQGTNQYKKKRKSKLKVIYRWIAIIVIITFIVNLIRDSIKTPYNDPGTMQTSSKDICAGNENCQAKIENLASQTLLDAKIKETKAKYDAELKDLNGQMEVLRSQELSLQ